MSFFPKQNTKSSETQSDSHITSVPSFNSTEEIEDWYRKNGKARGFNYAPSFWACPCKLHKLVIPKKHEKTLTAKGNSTWNITGVNKKWSLFDFPEESFHYIGETPSAVEGRRARSAHDENKDKSNDNSINVMENKMKILEEEVAALRRANQPSSSSAVEIKETRLQANRNYFNGRRSTYIPRGRGGFGGTEAMPSPRVAATKDKYKRDNNPTFV